jgi:hypothetical protein
MEEKEAFWICREKWQGERERLKERMSRFPMKGNDQQRLLHSLKMREDEEIAGIRAELAEKSREIRAAKPYTSWAAFLEFQVEHGDEAAKNIQQSKKKSGRDGAEEPGWKKFLQPEGDVKSAEFDAKMRERDEAKQRANERKAKIFGLHGISEATRKALLAVERMRDVLEGETGGSKGKNTPEPMPRWRVDTKGTVIFVLPSGATIRDTGGEIHFSAHDQRARELAEKLARKKWGPAMGLEGNILKWRKPMPLTAEKPGEKPEKGGVSL